MARQAPFNVTTWRPRDNRQLKFDKDGGISAEVITWYGLVKVFTYGGGEHGEAFTVLKAWKEYQVWETRLNKAYSARWLGRLAFQFAHQIERQIKERDEAFRLRCERSK